MLTDPYHRRMLPMYIAKFLRNMVFWYAVEKLFMVSIGFDNATIGLMVAIYSATSIAMEIPSGIMADRWSRKGVLVLGALCLMVSSVVGFLSHDIVVYMVCAIFWGMFDALASGTDDAIVYDTLTEERGHARDFEKEYGIYNAIGGAALLVSGFIGGIIGQSIGIRETFLWAVPLLFASAVVVSFFREPTFHKSLADSRLIDHTKKTFAVVFKNPRLIWVLITLFATGLAIGIIGEMNQTWLITVSAPIISFGIAGALINSAWGFSGIIARVFTSQAKIIAGIGASLFITLGLIYSRNYVVLTICLVGIMVITSAVFVAMLAQLHRHLPSEVRASASSAVNTVARLINIPLVLVFGIIAQRFSPFVAAWILVILLCIGLYSELHVRQARRAIT